MLRLALLLILAAQPLRAEEVVAGLSQTSVAISTDFSGSRILVFGAVKRETPIQKDPLQVIVTVSGPSFPLVVRKKDRVMGIWVNTESLTIDRAPSFYAVATSAPWQQSLSEVEDLRNKVSVARAIRSVGAPPGIENADRFTEALIRIKAKRGLYQTRPDSIEFDQETLFSTEVDLPANVTEGAYLVRYYLTRDGRVVDKHEETINVTKVGMERFLFNLSRQQPMVYGLLALVIAIAAGWGASAFFRYIRS